MRAAGRRAAGFTLVELLVVMTLLALAASLVAPRLMRWIEASQERARLDTLHGTLAGLPERAFFAQQAITVGGSAGLKLDLPDGWRLDLPAPLRYEPNGLTAGGEIAVHDAERELARWRVLPPAGRLEPVHAASP
ncbi:prepilin-type N-terminal cleavage/methylation domain-containing protein [Rubrivivax sp. JA1024]|nr:prepilin-type N-terminal cleavage/methylation domain-containing protein [Rubrivivax sp. JA1024]